MKQEVIKEMSTSDLVERLEETRSQYVKLKINHAVSPLDNPNKLNAYRKTVARLMTELRKRELQEKAK